MQKSQTNNVAKNNLKWKIDLTVKIEDKSLLLLNVWLMTFDGKVVNCSGSRYPHGTLCLLSSLNTRHVHVNGDQGKTFTKG